MKDFFSKCDQIHVFLRIWSHLLKKSFMENFIFRTDWNEMKTYQQNSLSNTLKFTCRRHTYTRHKFIYVTPNKLDTIGKIHSW